MTTVNRLATPLPDSVLDRYFESHPDEVDYRQHKHGAKQASECTCMTEDPGDGYGERVVTHSLDCPEHPEHDRADEIRDGKTASRQPDERDFEQVFDIEA